MAEKFYTGDSFPNLSLNLAGGKKFSIPQDIDSKFLIAVFYRGHW